MYDWGPTEMHKDEQFLSGGSEEESNSVSGSSSVKRDHGSRS